MRISSSAHVTRWLGAAAIASLVGCGAFPSLSAFSGSDASVDGGSDASHVGFCAGHPASSGGASFCDDFDDGQPLTVAWPSSERTPPDVTTLAIDSDASVSTPSSLLASVPANATNASMKSNAYVNVGSTTKGFHLEFDASIEQDDPTGGLFFASVRIGSGPDTSRYILTLHTVANHQLALQEQSPSDGGPQMAFSSNLTFTIVPGAWFHIELDLDLAAPSVSMNIDGKSALAPQPPKAITLTGPLTLRTGITYSVGPGTSLRARMDNVLLQLR